MDRKEPTGRSNGKSLQRDKVGNWFATFSILEIGGAMGSSTMRWLISRVANMWRLTVGKFIGRSKLRANVL